MPSILVIEDDLHILTGLVDNLEMEGYKTRTATDGRLGLKLALETRPDLLLLDVMLPGVDGLEICRQIRRRGLRTPIIILSARGQEFDKVLGLELGADDYISKPFSPKELLMRVRAILRRATHDESELKTVEFGNVRVHFTKYEVLKGQKPVKLTADEFTVLRLLAANAGEPVSRHKIMGEIWGEGVASRTVDTHIWSLREKLEDNPGKPVHIITVHRIGYKLVLDKILRES